MAEVESDSSGSCARCGQTRESFKQIETGLRLALETTGRSENLPPVVCSSCYEELTGLVSQGMKLRLEQEQREKNKMVLWKSRVNLIKQARQQMIHKAYAEAAISYEKYLRILEMVYSKKKGELTPDIFNRSKRSKELTVLASVYWDLMRIYDTSPQYGNRMQEAAAKLALFVPFSPLYPDIVKKAESFQRSAKNPGVVRGFLKATRGRATRCFVVSATFGSPYAKEVFVLCQFRDQHLRRHSAGRWAISTYYRVSPPIAKVVENSFVLQTCLRPFFRLIAFSIQNHVENKTHLRDLRDHVES